jgi:uncharacterized protein YqgC (DUF456 family)
VSTVLGVEVLTLVAFVLLVGGVVGSVVPMLPGAALSLAGVLLYWWHTGYAEPHVLILLVIVLGGLAAMLFDLLAGVVAAKASGASSQTTILAGVAGVVLFFVAGPLGILLGVAGVVFAVEMLQGGEAGASLRTAAYTTVGVIASWVVQLVVTLSILVVMILVVVL